MALILSAFLHVLVAFFEEVDQTFVAGVADGVLVAVPHAVIAASETCLVSDAVAVFTTDLADLKHSLGFTVPQAVSVSVILQRRVQVDLFFIVIAPL